MTAQRFEDLEVWKLGHQYVLTIYKMTARFPREELFGLSSQMRRAGVSIPANIAEGFRKRGKADKARYYNIAQASLEESRYYLILVSDLGYAATQTLSDDLDRLARMLDSYIRHILNSA